MRNLIRWMAPLGLIILIGGAGCTEPSADNAGDTGTWIDSDVQLDDPDTLGGADTATASDSGGDPGNGGSQDVGGGDDDTPDGSTTPDPADAGGAVDVGVPGGACETNADCATGDVCCLQDMQGGQSCQPLDACQVGGGTCNSDAECAPDEGCCDLGTGGPQICSTFCADDGGGDPGGIPGSGDSCERDSDCQNVNEVCCPGLLGSSCATDCGDGGLPGGGGGLPGGGVTTCSSNAECEGGAQCCVLMGQGICLPPGAPIPCE